MITRLIDGATANQTLFNAEVNGSFNYNDGKRNIKYQQLAVCSPGFVNFNGFCGIIVVFIY